MNFSIFFKDENFHLIVATKQQLAFSLHFQNFELLVQQLADIHRYKQFYFISINLAYN